MNTKTGRLREATVNSNLTGPEVSAQRPTWTDTHEIRWRAANLIHAIYTIGDRNTIKNEIITFIAAMDHVALSDEDLINRAAYGLVYRGKTFQDGLTLFANAFQRAESR